MLTRRLSRNVSTEQTRLQIEQDLLRWDVDLFSMSHNDLVRTAMQLIHI